MVANESLHLTRPKMRILAVDDDEVDRLALERGFRRSGIEVELIQARDGLEALEQLRHSVADGAPPHSSPGGPFIVLLDLNMPRLGGFEFLDQLRSDPALERTVVFVLTTSDRESDRIESYRRHVAGYVVKQRAGAGFSELIEMLERYWRVVDLPGS